MKLENPIETQAPEVLNQALKDLVLDWFSDNTGISPAQMFGVNVEARLDELVENIRDAFADHRKGLL